MEAIDRIALTTYKLERAKEGLAQAKLLIENNFFDGAVSRVYFACFYAMNALFVNKEIQEQKGPGANMFDLYFTTRGIISKESTVFYTHIFELRQKSDYEDMVYFKEDEVVPLLAPAERLIEEIKQVSLKK